MSIRRSAMVSASSLAALLVLACLPLAAQDSAGKKAAEKSSPPAAKREASRRVPRYFGQIGLTPEQRESIYKIQAKNRAKIDELQKQIDALESQTLTECEAVLTDTQKQLLAQRRRSADGSKPSAPSAVRESGK